MHVKPIPDGPEFSQKQVDTKEIPFRLNDGLKGRPASRKGKFANYSSN